jgi:hypothetical protein
MLVAHLFELGSAVFPYYYVSENCSYQIIAALEPALPEAGLVDRLKWPVLPADTVKTLYEIPGLVGAVHYRPSLVTQFTARVAGFDSRERAAVRELARNAEAPLDPSLDQVRVLDAASDLIDVRYAHELPFHPEGEGGQIKRRVLERRSQILKPSQELALEAPPDRQPQLAHGSGRAGVSGGYSDVAGGFAALDWRLTLHDLGEPARGYPELSQIEFLPVELRYYPRSQTVQLESFDFVNLVSLTPFTLFDPTLSRKVFIGAHRIRDDGCGGCLAFSAGYSSGFTFATSAGGLALFALADGTLEASPDLKGIWQAQAIRFGIGPSGGVRLRLGDRGVFLAQGGWRWLPGAVAHQTWFAQSSVHVQPLRWLGLAVTGRKEVNAAEVMGQALVYF